MKYILEKYFWPIIKQQCKSKPYFKTLYGEKKIKNIKKYRRLFIYCFKFKATVIFSTETIKMYQVSLFINAFVSVERNSKNNGTIIFKNTFLLLFGRTKEIKIFKTKEHSPELNICTYLCLY